MAPITGGGPPVGSGNTFTGTAKALEVYGDFAAAYSGGIPLNNETKTFLSFTTGNYLLVAQTQTTVKITDMAANKMVRTKISLNGAQIMDMAPQTNATSGFGDLDPMYIIVPAYTVVLVEVQTNDTQSLNFFVTLTGRIYRG